MPKDSRDAPEPDEIPELEDVVDTTAAGEAGPVPPPNLDLFAAGNVDLEALHDMLMARLDDEIDVVVAELHVALEETVRRHFEVRLRERLPGILGSVLKDAGSENNNNE